MSTLSSAIKTTLFTLFVPLVIGGWVPQRIFRASAPRVRALLLGDNPGLTLFAHLLGLALIMLGIAGYLWCATLFIRAQGTPAPIFPTHRAVVTGPYRINRNPMYTSVFAAIVGQSILYRNFYVLLYAVGMILVAHIFVVLYEEPTLRRQFGGEYEQFCRSVPRWLPKLSDGR